MKYQKSYQKQKEFNFKLKICMKRTKMLLSLYLVLNFLMPVESLSASDEGRNAGGVPFVCIPLACACSPVICFGVIVCKTECAQRAGRNCCTRIQASPNARACLRSCGVTFTDEVPVSAVAITRQAPIGAVVATTMEDRNLPVANIVATELKNIK